MASKQALVLLATLALVNTVIRQVHCNDDGPQEDTRGGSMASALTNYLELVPTSHKTRAAANRLISILHPDEKAKDVKGDHASKYSSSFRDAIEKVLDSINYDHDTGCQCLCPQGKCPQCGPASSLEDCSCPLCPLPIGCKPTKSGEKCPQQTCSCPHDEDSTELNGSETVDCSTMESRGKEEDSGDARLCKPKRPTKKPTKKPKKKTTKKPSKKPKKPTKKPKRPSKKPKTTTKKPTTSTTGSPSITTPKPVNNSTSEMPSPPPQPSPQPSPQSTPQPSPQPTPVPANTTEPTGLPDYGGEYRELMSGSRTGLETDENPMNGENPTSTKRPNGAKSVGRPGPLKTTKIPSESTKLPSTTILPDTTSSPTTTGSPAKTNRPATTHSVSTSGKPSAALDQRLSGFSGQRFFEKNLPVLIKDDKIRNAILKMINSIPHQTGGRETQLAASLIANFGENPPTIIEAHRAGERNLTYGNARENFKTIMGHLLELRERKRCKCKDCPWFCDSNLCNIEEFSKKENIVKPICQTGPRMKCGQCPKNPTCPKSDGCPQNPPCPACNETDDFNDDGHEALDDVDPRNPVKESETNTCTGFTCEFEKTCGEANLNPLTPKGGQSGYMNGGEDEKYGEWPQFARVDIRRTDGGSLCGGVIISNRHILTAAHCVHTETGVKVKSDNIKVKLAEHDKRKKDEFEKDFKLDSICASSKFRIKQDVSPKYDFAVLTLNQNITFNDHIQPACMPYNESSPAHKCFVVGMGITEFDSIGRNHTVASTVQKMALKRVSCKNWGVRHDDRSRWCFTKARGPGDSCSGDSGGPVLCLSKAKRWTVMGLVSYGQEACDGTESFGWVGAYARVPALLKQIQEDCKI